MRDLGASPREHPAGGRASTASAPEVSLAGIEVLVIDDEPDARELVTLARGGDKSLEGNSDGRGR